MATIIRVSLLGILAGILLAGCESNPSATSADTGALFGRTIEPPEFPGAGSFVAGISNPYLAYEPGKVFNYCGETEEGTETIVVTVTGETKVIMGVTTTVIHDQVYLDDALIEDTFDWIAQDEDGNVWYFGELSQEIEGGEVVSTEGSWEAGVNGALPGILMFAEPEPGTTYAQEFAPDVAEDQARVKRVDASVSIDYGDFDGVLQTVEWNALEPGSKEYKYYAPDVGLVLETSVSGKEQIALCSVE